MTRTKLTAVLSTAVGAGLLLWSARPAQAFVPACDTELAVNYSPVLRADLSVCKVKMDPQPAASIDLKHFTEQLDGTWVLQSRTIQGITQASHSRYHIEVDQQKGGGAQGTAMLLDCADAECAQSRVAGMWSLDFGATADRIALTARGKMVLPSGKAEVNVATQEASQSKFFQQEGVYVAMGNDVGALPGGQRAWDRVVLTEKTLTYISCADGRVDRFVKSSPSPLVDGKPVREMQKEVVVGRMIKTERGMP
jgi:hypothetical protein